MSWRKMSLKYVARFAYGDALPRTDDESEGHVKVFGSNGPYTTFSQANTRAPAVVIGRKGSYGKVNWTKEACFASDTTFFVDETMTKQCLRWLFYVFQTLNLDKGTDEAAVPGLNRDNAYEKKVLVPPLPEQRTIADFLDRETAKIDELILEKERLLELLAEKRRALITHAATRGLDPDVPMRDSGVEWLGEIPEHWSVRRLRHISPFLTVGVVVNPSTYVTDHGVPFLFGSDVTEEGINTADSRCIPEEISDGELSKTRLRAGDLVTVRVGYPGITAVVPPELEGANCASMMLIRQASSFDSFWLCYAMNSGIGRCQIEQVQYGAAQKQFNISHAVDFFFPFPPFLEQRSIAHYLDKETARLSGLTSIVKKNVELLHERRTALISAAVTGQIRGALQPCN